MEIVVFENHIPYDHTVVVENPIEQFIKMCKRYVNPEYVDKKDTDTCFGKTFVSYSDNSGGDKPMIVILMGINEDMIPTIKNALDDIYINKCRCGTIIDMKMCVCNECSDKCEYCDKMVGFCECEDT
jgi:hypothetical protein